MHKHFARKNGTCHKKSQLLSRIKGIICYDIFLYLNHATQWGKKRMMEALSSKLKINTWFNFHDSSPKADEFL